MPEIKPVEDVVCLVHDYGYFANLADKLSEKFSKVYYYSPVETEFRDIGNSIYGDGLEKVERLDDWNRPELLREIDLFVFPDTGNAPLQNYLRSIGKPVWGSFDASAMEYSRTKFVDIIKSLGLPVAFSVKCHGLTELSEHLKTVKNKWVKINKFRANMETWHHLDYQHSERKLESLALDFGGAGESVWFLVQDHIDTEIETGYDGWNIDGRFPVCGFCGYEAKNQAYLAALTDYDDLPPGVIEVNKAMAPLLAKYGYRNFFSTEVRIKDGVPHFIDPTLRAAGLAMEQQQESLTNLAKVIWRGANGELIEPEYNAKFCVEATIHYTGEMAAWKILRVPDEIRRWFKADHYCVIDGAYHYPANQKSDELGVMLGLGDSPEEAIEHLKANIEALGDEPASVDMEAIAELLQKAHDGKADGVNFGYSEVPDPAIVVRPTEDNFAHSQLE